MSADREPIFNAPWPPVVLVVAILGGYALQTMAPQDALFERFGFSPSGFAAGERIQLVTALFLHGGWAHAGMNAAGALAFGAPVARLFGPKAIGVLGFFVFYLLCGALSSWSFALIHPGDSVTLVGASGAISGLMGAVSRLVAGRGRLGPFLSAPVIGMAAAWLIVNLIVAVVGFAPGVGEATVAWEAHLTGYAAGLLLIGPAAWSLRRT